MIVLGGLAACDPEVTTTAAYHESAPFDLEPPRPALTFSTYLGGSGDDRVLDVASTLGPSPRVFVVGGTSSADFPTTDGSAVDGTVPAGCAGCPYDGFAMRLDAPGRVVWSTVIGGPGFEHATAVAVALDLDLFVGGSAASLPATTGAADATFAAGATAERGPEDGFVCRLDGDTGAVQWCTFVGGSGAGGVTALAADPAGDGVVAVLTTAAAEALASDPAYAAAFTGRQRAVAGGRDAAVVRITADGTAFSWATYVGGSGDEPAPATVAVDVNGVHVLTTTTSTDAPVPNGFQPAAGAGTNAYYALLADDGATVRYGTYLGGAGDDWVSGKSLVAEGAVVVGLNTRSTNLGVSAGAVQPTYGGDGSAGCGAALGDGWIATLAPASSGASSLTGATYVGGARGDSLDAVTTDRAFDAVIAVGQTFSSDYPTFGVDLPLFPSLSGSPCTVTPDNGDGAMALWPRGASFASRRFGSFLGGSGEDQLTAVDRGDGLVVFGGDTRSLDLPTTRPLSAARRGPRDGLVAVLGFWAPPAPPAGDAGLDGTAGGAGDSGGDDAGCCAAAPRSASRSLGLALLGLATAAGLRRRRRR